MQFSLQLVGGDNLPIEISKMEETINGNISNLEGNSQLEVKERHIIVKMKVILRPNQNDPGVPST